MRNRITEGIMCFSSLVSLEIYFFVYRNDKHIYIIKNVARLDNSVYCAGNTLSSLATRIQHFNFIFAHKFLQMAIYCSNFLINYYFL